MAFTDLSDMDRTEFHDDDRASDETTPRVAMVPIVDHPSPVTLRRPASDDRGLLR
ncbi:MAG: hypothetical protein IH941_01555 [Acidobacteria bacterium]|nr:hypothetical protein [Acidobacteriota bacterium]